MRSKRRNWTNGLVVEYKSVLSALLGCSNERTKEITSVALNIFKDISYL